MILGVTTFSIETLCIVGLFLTISLNDTQHNNMLSVIMLTVAFYFCYTECRHAECHYAECPGAILANAKLG
jgi:hypothetical protein